jgi:hypothetical protein
MCYKLHHEFTFRLYSNLGPVEGEDEGDCGDTLPETVTFIISKHFKLYVNPGLFTFVHLYNVFRQRF